MLLVLFHIRRLRNASMETFAVNCVRRRFKEGLPARRYWLHDHGNDRRHRDLDEAQADRRDPLRQAELECARSLFSVKPAFAWGAGNVFALKGPLDVPSGAGYSNGKCLIRHDFALLHAGSVVMRPVEQGRAPNNQNARRTFPFLAEADQLAKIVATQQRSLNPAIVGKICGSHCEDAGLRRAAGKRCFDGGQVGGWAAIFRLSIKSYLRSWLSMCRWIATLPERSRDILGIRRHGHTAGVHTRSREAAIRFGAECQLRRITVNTPQHTAHRVFNSLCHHQ